MRNPIKLEKKIEIIVNGEELEHYENSEYCPRDRKIQAAIHRKIKEGVFEELIPPTIEKNAIVLDRINFSAFFMGYEVSARVFVESLGDPERRMIEGSSQGAGLTPLPKENKRLQSPLGAI